MVRWSGKLALAAIVVVFAYGAFACGGGQPGGASPFGPAIGGGGSGGGTGGGDGVFKKGDNVVAAQQTVGPEGGALVGPSGTPIEGVSVTFPAGALPHAVSVSLGYNTGALSPVSGVSGGAVVLLQTPGVKSFRLPVQITIPYVADDDVPVPYYIDDSGQLHLAMLRSIAAGSGTATFETFHASLYTWILQRLGIVDEEISRSLDYAPASDSFQITNLGSVYNRDGECFGMAAFSLWYFQNHSGDADFYPRFMGTVGTDSDGATILGQNVIATRAFISIAQQWNSYWPEVAKEIALTETQRYASVVNALDNTGSPVLIYLYHDTTSGNGAHSVLAYAYDQEVGDPAEISIYDPNHPGESRIVEFDPVSGSFEDYTVYDGIVYSGDGSLLLTEPFESILEDALSEFHSSSDAVIEFASYQSGDAVEERNPVLTGSVESGQVAVEQLDVLVGSVVFSGSVDYDGYFQLPVSLESGTNHLQFVTKGRDSDGNFVIVPNSTMTEDFTLYGAFEEAVVLVTLNWDTDESDVDLYVTGPDGDVSWYQDEVMDDGGELDYDVTDGYGPEHWTLSASDTVRWGESYQVRLHFFDDDGMGPTVYTVTVEMYEGQDGYNKEVFTGTLSHSDSDNTGPGSTGADWAEITTITPLAQEAGN